MKHTADKRLLAEEAVVTTVCVASLNSAPAPVHTVARWIRVTYPYYVSAKSIVCTILFTVRHSNGGNINRTERVSWGRRVCVCSLARSRMRKHAGEQIKTV